MPRQVGLLAFSRWYPHQSLIICTVRATSYHGGANAALRQVLAKVTYR